MSEIFYHYLFILISTSLLLYLTGFALLKVLGFACKDAFTSVFLKLFVGCFSFTAICALYFTSLKTIFSGLIIFCLFFLIGFWKERRKRLFQRNNLQKELLVVLLFVIVTAILYSYRFYSLSYNGASILNIPNTDFSFYARISYFIVDTGIETATPTLVYPELNTVDPYHYFDLWFNGGISYFTGGDNLQILFLVSYTIGISLVWLGFCSIAESLNKLSFLNVLFAALGTFFIPLPSFFSEGINDFMNKFLILTHAPAEYIDYGLWNMTKLYPVYLILIGSMLALIKKEKIMAIAIFLTLPIIYSTICIPTMLTVSIYILVDYVFISKDKRLFLYSIACLFTITLFFLLFYYSYLIDPLGNGINPFKRFGVEPFYKSILRPVKVFFDTTLQLLILILPFLIFLILELHHRIGARTIPTKIFNAIKNSEGAQMAFVLYFSALATWSVLYDFGDANQFFAGSAIPLINILCFVVVIYLSKWYLKIIAFVLSIHFVNYTTGGIFEQRLNSETYMNEIADVIKSKGRICGYLLSKQDYQEGYGYNIVEVLGDYITLFRPDIYFVNLSLSELPLSAKKMASDSMQFELARHDFHKFIFKQQKSNQYSSITQSRIDFIDEFNLDYLVISSRVKLDSLLEARVNRRITDAYSGHVFLLLNKTASNVNTEN